MLASIGGSLDSLDDGGEAGPISGAPYSSFDGDDASFLMALRQPKRKSIRQVRAVGRGGRGLHGSAASVESCAGAAASRAS